MALTKEFEYDCEVRGEHKNVQVRKATIIKDGDEELAAPTIATFSTAAQSLATLGAILTLAVKTARFRPCATLCGQMQSRPHMKQLWMHK